MKRYYLVRAGLEGLILRKSPGFYTKKNRIKQATKTLNSDEVAYVFWTICRERNFIRLLGKGQ